MDEGEENGNEKKNLVSQDSSGKLKPVFESIFAEVQANIPVLNLDDISDDEVDGQVPVFSRRELPSIQSSSDEEEIIKEIQDENPQAVSAGENGFTKKDSGERWARKTKQLSDDLPSTPMAPNSVHLNFGELSNLDLEEFLVHFNLVPSRDIESLISDGSDDNNNAKDQQSESIALMEELTVLSERQLADSAPSPRILPTILHQSLITDHSREKADVSVCAASISGIEYLRHLAENGSQATRRDTGTDDDQLSLNANEDAACGTSDMQLHVSRGVSATFGGLKRVNSWKDIEVEEDRGSTVFLDLRNENSKDVEQNSAASRLLQRLPNHHVPLNEESSDDSSSEDEFDLAAARKAIKERGCQLKQKKPLEGYATEQTKVATIGVKTTDKRKVVAYCDDLAPISYKPQSKERVEQSTETQTRNLRKRPAEITSKIEMEKTEKIPVKEKCKTETVEPMSHLAASLNARVNHQDSVTVVDLEEESENKIIRNKRELEKLKLHQEQEKAKRQRLQKSLENLRPSVSSGGRYNAAINTPVVFDQEASYEELLASLPELTTGRSYLLLSTKLVTCGELASVRCGNKAVPNADTHIYTSLLAWLLSMVPSSDKDNLVDYAHVCGVPFYVIGLQQSWHEGQLMIEVGIVNRDIQELPGTLQSQARGKNVRGAGNFKASVNKFLTTNSLQSVFTKMARCGVKAPSNPCLNQVAFNQRNLATYLHINPDPNAMTRVFGTELAFFWQTAELEETLDTPPPIPPTGNVVENTVMLMQHAVYHEPFCMLDVLWRVWRIGLDVSGIRLLYTAATHATEDNSSFLHTQGSFSPQKTNSSTLVAESHNPIVAIAIRGPSAISLWLDEVGPQDPFLASRTDPNSLRALYSCRQTNKEDRLFYCPRNAEKASSELARWFGGRVPGSGVVNVGKTDINPPESCATKTRRLPTSFLHHNSARPPSMLVSTTDTQLLLLISPAVPVRFIGTVLNICHTRGFSVQGVRRMRLNYRRMNGIGFTQAQLAVFCPKSSPSGSPGQSPSCTSDSHNSKPLFDFESENWRMAPAVATTVLWLNKENGSHHAASLVEVATLKLKEYGCLPEHICNKEQLLAVHLCFLPVPYNEAVLKHVGGDFSHVPDSAIYSSALFRHSFYSNPELEQVCVVTLLNEKATRCGGDILNYLLLEKPLTGSLTVDTGLYCGFELLGLKLLPHLSTHQAKEFAPFEVGTAAWQESLQTLTSGPALVCALRGIGAFSRLQNFIHSYTRVKGKGYTVSSQQNCPDIVMATTPELAYRQLSVMFHERELYSDQSARKNLRYLPPPRRTLSSGQSSSNESLNSLELTVTRRTKRRKLNSVQQKGLMNGACGGIESIVHEEVPLLQSLLNGPRPITTVAILKPEATGKHLGRVLRRFAQERFSVVAMRMDYLDKQTAVTLCQDEQAADKSHNDVKKSASHMTSGPVLITCLQRENSVKHLLDILGPQDPRTARQVSQFLLRGCFGVDETQNGLYGSVTYDIAVRDQRLLFPGGLCCTATVDLKAEGIPCLAVDEIFDTTPKRSVVKSTHSFQGNEDTPSLSLLPTSLLEINCVLLLPSLVKCDSSQGGHRGSAFTEVIDGLVSQAGFRVVGLRMVLFSQQQADHCIGLYHVPLECKPHLIANELTKRPSIVLALLRDNAVTCFEMLLGSSGKRDSLSTKYGKHILAARTPKQAERLLECFFEKLMLNPKAEIVLDSHTR